MFHNLSKRHAAYYTGIGYLVDAFPRASIKLNFEFTNQPEPPRTRFASFSIGANYYFSSGMNSLFVGGDMGFGFIFDEVRPDKGGVTLGTTVGIAFLRTSDSQLHLAFRYQALLKENSSGIPGQFGPALSILF